MDRAPLIAFFLPSFGVGGTERGVLALLKDFNSRRFRVHLVLARAEGSLLPEVPEGVRVIDLHALRMSAALWPFVRYLRQHRPDVIFPAMDVIDVIALLARKIVGGPSRAVIKVTNTFSMLEYPALKKAVLRLFIALSYPWADAIITPSRGVTGEVSRLSKASRSKITTVYNPVIGESFNKKRDEPIDHPWFQTGTPVILGVGRLARQKDFPTLVRAFALVRAQTEARLVILGEGAERANLENLILKLGLEEDALLLGLVPNPFPYMKRAGVFVLSSAWEGLGNVLVEALACGCPVVSTDCPSGPREILHGGVYGELVPVGDIEAMAAAILKVLRGEKKRVDPSWLEQFSEAHVARRYLELAGLIQGEPALAGR